jgi:hypothetical protein
MDTKILNQYSIDKFQGRDGSITWFIQERDPMTYLPVNDVLFQSEDKYKVIQFLSSLIFS